MAVAMRRVYMDANATTPLAPEVFAAMRPCMEDQFGNASSVHRHGQQARAAVERARENVAPLLGCRAAEIIFTSGGTESDNLAIFGVIGAHLAAGVPPGEMHIITSAIEHHAVINAVRKLEQRGVRATWIEPDSQGRVVPDDVRRALTPQTRLVSVMLVDLDRLRVMLEAGPPALVSVMLANNETGVLQPGSEIAQICAEAGVPFHTDAVQGAGKIRLRVAEIGCQLLSISAHKMHGPQGVGALYVSKSVLLEPMLFGGAHERRRRAGTENLPGIVGLGRAAELAEHEFATGEVTNMQRLRDRLESGLQERISDCGVNGADVPRVPNTTNLWFDGIEGEAAVVALDLKELAVSSGAACSSGAIEPSHVLTAMRLSPERARSSLRFSLGKHSSDADVDFALEVVPEAVAHMRALSPALR
jgi:cysteine desulfurase